MNGVHREKAPGILERVRRLRLMQAFLRTSIKRKVLFIFIFVSLAPILLLQSVSLILLYSSLKEEISQFAREDLRQTEKNLDIVIIFFRDMLLQIATDRNLIENTRMMDSELDQERYEASEHLRTKLVSLANSQRYIRGIAVYSARGNSEAFDKQTLWIKNSFWNHVADIRRTPLFDQAMTSNAMIIKNLVFRDPEDDMDYHLCNLIMRLGDLTDINSEVGVVAMTIDEKAISDACSFTSIGETSREARNITFVIDSDGIVISYPMKEYIGTPIDATGSDPALRLRSYREFVNETAILKSRRMIVNEIDQPLTGWRLVNVIDEAHLFGEISRFQFITLMLGGIVALSSILIILSVLRSLSGSISKIVSTMKIVQGGQLLARVPIETMDEISIIGENFNAMMLRINSLIAELKHQMTLAAEANERSRKAEVTALEAQMNPHFLYNTLDSINWMAIERNENQISNMLKNLAQILRYSIQRSNSIVAISDEIEWLKQYVYLQKTRFCDSFECDIDADSELMDFRLHKLLLQPFVENAIIHGFQGVTSGGLLTIAVRGRDGKARIIIQDNGRGIEEATLALLHEMTGDHPRDCPESGTRGVGIRNTLARMRICYGTGASILIQSSPGAGTTVTLDIPPLGAGEGIS